MSVVAGELGSVIADQGLVLRLLVTRQGGGLDRHYRPMGFLSMERGWFRFAYLRSVVDDPSIRPLPGLSDVRRVHEAPGLFPVFAERVMSPRRADYSYVMDALGLSHQAGPFEVLARSGGRRVGDTIELIPVPEPEEDGSLTVDYFVHGVRHMTAHAQKRISQLRFGDGLLLVAEPDNRVESRAVLVTDTERLRLGYVPSPLLDLVRALRAPLTTVLRANGPEVGFHFRLLIRTSGTFPLGHRPFTGPEWATVE